MTERELTEKELTMADQLMATMPVGEEFSIQKKRDVLNMFVTAAEGGAAPVMYPDHTRPTNAFFAEIAARLSKLWG